MFLRKDIDFSRRGLTLIEVLITLGLISVLIAAVILIALSIFRSWPVDSKHTDQRLMASVAVERILGDLRDSLEILAVTGNQISVWLDINDNGLKPVPDTAERVTFSWSGVSGASLYRTKGINPGQVLLAGIANFSITCFDQNNNILTYPIADLKVVWALQVELSSKIDDELISRRFRVKVRNL